MAKKQSRRTISFNREAYEAIVSAAQERGVPLSAFVEESLRTTGVAIPHVVHMRPRDVQIMVRNRWHRRVRIQEAVEAKLDRIVEEMKVHWGLK